MYLYQIIIKSWSLFLRRLPQGLPPAYAILLWASVTYEEISGKMSFHQRFVQFKVWPSPPPYWLNTDVIGFCKDGIERLVYRWNREKYTTRTAWFPSTHISVWAKKLALLVYPHSLYVTFIKERDHGYSERREVSCICPDAHKSVPRPEIMFLLFIL